MYAFGGWRRLLNFSYCIVCFRDIIHVYDCYCNKNKVGTNMYHFTDSDVQESMKHKIVATTAQANIETTSWSARLKLNSRQSGISVVDCSHMNYVVVVTC